VPENQGFTIPQIEMCRRIAMTVSRRQMLLLGAGAAAAWLTGEATLSAAEAGKLLRRRRANLINDLPGTRKLPVGLQLWSVRQQCEKELPVVLKALAQMGYTAVELAHSYYGHSAADWRKLLDENRLKSCGMHMGLPALEGGEFQKTVEIHKTIGTPYLIVASLPKESVESVAAIKETAKHFNEISERLKPHGMKVGYHCHGGDFTKVEGTTPWEALAENTIPDVILQIDLGNCLDGGGDPIAMLKKFPGRTVSIHLKEHGGKPGAVLGEGDIRWKEVFQICETTGGTKQYIIEDESRDGPEALDAVKRALANLRKMGK
jgi:sugar phosphate isomerase/epimerase